MTESIERRLGLDQRFPWSFTGVLLALVFGGFAIYSFVHEKHPNLVYEIENQSDVFDLQRPLPDLNLSFRGLDVQQQDLNLRILTVRIWNRGGLDILQNQYDQEEQWGLKVSTGQIVEVRVGQNNSNYLASHISPKVSSNDTVTFAKVIFERDKFVTLEVLVLHHRSTPPKISPLGKIAGIDEITVVDASGQRGKPGFWEQVLSGSLGVHVTRFFSYLGALIAFVLSLGWLTSMLEALRRRKRRRQIAPIAADITLSPDILEVLKQAYIWNGREALNSIKQDLEKDGRLRSAIVKFQASQKNLEGASESGPGSQGSLVTPGLLELDGPPGIYRDASDGRILYRGDVPLPIRALIMKGAIGLAQDGTVKIDASLKPALDSLIQQLRK